jgi:hypothetical protein
MDPKTPPCPGCPAPRSGPAPAAAAASPRCASTRAPRRAVSARRRAAPSQGPRKLACAAPRPGARPRPERSAASAGRAGAVRCWTPGRPPAAARPCGARCKPARASSCDVWGGQCMRRLWGAAARRPARARAQQGLPGRGRRTAAAVPAAPQSVAVRAGPTISARGVAPDSLPALSSTLSPPARRARGACCNARAGARRRPPPPSVTRGRPRPAGDRFGVAHSPPSSLSSANPLTAPPSGF